MDKVINKKISVTIIFFMGDPKAVIQIKKLQDDMPNPNPTERKTFIEASLCRGLLLGHKRQIIIVALNRGKNNNTNSINIILHCC